MRRRRASSRPPLAQARAADRDDRRVLRLLLERDRVEPLAHVPDAAHEFEAHLPPDVRLDYGRGGEDAVARAAEPEHERAVVELAGDDGVDALRVEPGVERPADLRVVAREEERGAVQRLGEPGAVAGRESRVGEERDARLAEQVVEAPDLPRGADRGVA